MLKNKQIKHQKYTLPDFIIELYMKNYPYQNINGLLVSLSVFQAGLYPTCPNFSPVFHCEFTDANVLDYTGCFWKMTIRLKLGQNNTEVLSVSDTVYYCSSAFC